MRGGYFGTRPFGVSRVPAGPGCAVGGGPPASRPRRELRSARRLEARPGPATAHRHRSQALRILRHPPHRRHLVCGCVRLAPHPPCMRYKVRPARVVGGQSGTKFALHARNLPKRAISSEQGEFCTESGAVWLVRGELFRVHRHCNQASKSSTSTEARPSCASQPAIPAKPVVYADRLLRYG